MQSKEANSMMEKLKAYTNNFIHDESGMEVIQAAGIVVISVFLLSLLLKVGTTIGDYIKKANDTADEKFNDTMNKIPQ